MAPEVAITFTGGRKFTEPRQTAAFNASRYKWVKKKFERTDVVAGGTAEEAIVYNTGTLYGEWPDGEPFAGNHSLDRSRRPPRPHREDGRVERQRGDPAAPRGPREGLKGYSRKSSAISERIQRLAGSWW